jgi:hypothetical protein
MTPQERELVADLFERLASLESAPRDREAERAIAEGLEQAPNAVYALVQTVLVQDEALKQADARIRELQGTQGNDAEPSGSFLDTMRGVLLGRPEPSRPGSVPSVRRSDTPMGVPRGFGGGTPTTETAPPQRSFGAGGSFLGTAAAAAAGVIGGSLLLDGIRSLGGLGTTGQAQAATNDASPWSASQSGELGDQAGLNDIGRGPEQTHARRDDQGQFETAEYEHEEIDTDDFGDGLDGGDFFDAP